MKKVRVIKITNPKAIAWIKGLVKEKEDRHKAIREGRHNLK